MAVWKGWLPTLLGYSAQARDFISVYLFFAGLLQVWVLRDLQGRVQQRRRRGERQGLQGSGARLREAFAHDRRSGSVHLRRLSSSPTLPCAPWRWSRSRCRRRPMARGPLASSPPWRRWLPTRRRRASRLARWCRCGAARSRTPWCPRVCLCLTSKAKFFFFEKIVALFYEHVFTEPKFVLLSSPLTRTGARTARPRSSPSRSPRATWLVLSAPLCHTPRTPWCLSSARPRTRVSCLLSL